MSSSDAKKMISGFLFFWSYKKKRVKETAHQLILMSSIICRHFHHYRRLFFRVASSEFCVKLLDKCDSIRAFKYTQKRMREHSHPWWAINDKIMSAISGECRGRNDCVYGHSFRPHLIYILDLALRSLAHQNEIKRRDEISKHVCGLTMKRVCWS